MYDNVGTKLKSLALIGAICGIVGSVIGGLVSGNILLGLLIIVVGSLVSWLSSLTLYAFGEMHEYLGNIRGYCQSVTQAVRNNNKSSANTATHQAQTNVENKDYSNQTKITIPSGLTTIGSGAFGHRTSLTSVTIPSSVTSIGGYAFFDCTSLTSITIPDSVTSIGGSAFRGCTSLTEIHYNGTKAQWNVISKGDYWNFNTDKYTIYCTDGEIVK